MVAFEGFFVEMGPRVFQQVGLAFGLKLAKVAFEASRAVDALHVLDVAVPAPGLKGTRLQVAFVDDVGGVDELMTP